MDNVNLNKLAHTLAIEDCKRMYGDEAMYKINYDEFCGLVLILSPNLAVQYSIICLSLIPLSICSFKTILISSAYSEGES